MKGGIAGIWIEIDRFIPWKCFIPGCVSRPGISLLFFCIVIYRAYVACPSHRFASFRFVPCHITSLHFTSRHGTASHFISSHLISSPCPSPGNTTTTQPNPPHLTSRILQPLPQLPLLLQDLELQPLHAVLKGLLALLQSANAQFRSRLAA